jgi:hypothetical protein
MFENAYLIHRYTRADALRDGVSIGVSATAREVGLRYSVALTAAVWEKRVSVLPWVCSRYLVPHLVASGRGWNRSISSVRMAQIRLNQAAGRPPGSRSVRQIFPQECLTAAPKKSGNPWHTLDPNGALVLYGRWIG